jgi:hypothetical protein
MTAQSATDARTDEASHPVGRCQDCHVTVADLDRGARGRFLATLDRVLHVSSRGIVCGEVRP